MDSSKGISLLVVKDLPIGLVNERMTIHYKRRKSHAKHLHIQDMQLINSGHVRKVNT